MHHLGWKSAIVSRYEGLTRLARLLPVIYETCFRSEKRRDHGEARPGELTVNVSLTYK